MEIRIPKPSCPLCKSNNVKPYSSNDKFECNNCGFDYYIEIVWKEEPQFCNCDPCKKLMVDKGCEVN